MNLPESIIDDLSYLESELRALAPLIDIIPLDEKPGGEASIGELLSVIDFVQSDVIQRIKVGELISILGNVHEYLQGLESSFYNQISQSDENSAINYNLIINSTVKNRTKLVKLLNKIELPSDTYVLFEALVVFERSIFRTIAERMFSIRRVE